MPTAAPARRPASKAAPAAPSRLPAGVERRTQGIATWARDIRSELRKVAWPTKEDAARLTAVVLVISIAVGLFLGGVDALFGALMQWFLS